MRRRLAAVRRRALRAAAPPLTPCLLALWLLAGCAHWSGPPAGRGATVELVLDGRTTRADVYRPDAGAAAGGGGAAELAVVLAHGYSRSRANMAGHAARLAQVGVLAVAPDLPYSTDEPGNARALADLVGQLRAGAFAPPVRSVVLVGFSAGGLAALLAAATPGVIGYVGLDPFDRPDHPGRRFAATLATPAALLRAAPSACNGQGVAAPWAALLPHLDADRLFEGATHCDFESPTDWICRFACGGADAARQRAIADALLQQIVAWRDAAAH